MMFVGCHFQKCLRGSKKVLNTHGRHGGPNKLIGDQVQVCSIRPPPGHHVTFGPKMERDQGQHVLGAGFGLHD
jgi:hypothetical protein